MMVVEVVGMVVLVINGSSGGVGWSELDISIMDHWAISSINSGNSKRSSSSSISRSINSTKSITRSSNISSSSSSISRDHTGRVRRWSLPPLEAAVTNNLPVIYQF